MQKYLRISRFGNEAIRRCRNIAGYPTSGLERFRKSRKISGYPGSGMKLIRRCKNIAGYPASGMEKTDNLNKRFWFCYSNCPQRYFKYRKQT
jgi:hypothetical protein